jgi:hypothetical protein
MRFKIWLEQNLRRDQQSEVQKIYDLALQTLLGGAKDQTQLSLSDISDDSGKSGSSKGPMVVFNKLNKAQVFEKLKALGNPDLQTRADQAQQYLQSSANTQKVGPNKTVGQLMMMLFGDDALNTYGKHQWKSAPQVDLQTPEDNPQASPNALSPPMGQGDDQAQLQPNAPLDPNAAPQQPGMEQPPLDPAMQQMPPPQPGSPLPNPGGPMPPQPPGGLAMA